MKSILTSRLLLILGCYLLIEKASATTSATSKASRTWQVLQSFNNGQDFVPRGTVELSVNPERGDATMSIENHASCLDEALVGQMMVSGRYQLKLVDDKSTTLSTVPACQVRQANFRDEITVTLNQMGDAISLSYIPLVSPLAPPCAELIETEIKEGATFESRISYETSVPAMTIPNVLPATKPQVGLKLFPRSQGGQVPGANPDGSAENQPFFLRYWYIFLPIIIMTFLGGADEPPPQDGQHQQDSARQGPSGHPPAGGGSTGGVATPNPGTSAPRRRGKRG